MSPPPAPLQDHAGGCPRRPGSRGSGDPGRCGDRGGGAYRRLIASPVIGCSFLLHRRNGRQGCTVVPGDNTPPPTPLQRMSTDKRMDSLPSTVQPFRCRANPYGRAPTRQSSRRRGDGLALRRARRARALTADHLGGVRPVTAASPHRCYPTVAVAVSRVFSLDLPACTVYSPGFTTNPPEQVSHTARDLSFIVDVHLVRRLRSSAGVLLNHHPRVMPNAAGKRARSPVTINSIRRSSTGRSRPVPGAGARLTSHQRLMNQSSRKTRSTRQKSG